MSIRKTRLLRTLRQAMLPRVEFNSKGERMITYGLSPDDAAKKLRLTATQHAWVNGQRAIMPPRNCNR